MTAATHELVWGHSVLHTEVDGSRVRYPLIVTPVGIEFDADRSVVRVVPQGLGRLQTDSLAGLDERYLGQLLALAGPGGQVDLDVWDDLSRREFAERALRRLGHDPTIRDASGPTPRSYRTSTTRACCFSGPGSGCCAVSLQSCATA